jgi:guanylate kinase
MTNTSPLVIWGSTAVGKDTLCNTLLGLFPNACSKKISYTTRQPRAGERDGVDYFFVTAEKMQQMIDNNEFIEHATVHGNRYGTTKGSITAITSQGRVCIMILDCQGVVALQSLGLNPVCVAVVAPSLAVLKQRLLARGSESEESVAVRLAAIATEDRFLEDHRGWFARVIVNDQFDDAIAELVEVAVERNGFTAHSAHEKMLMARLSAERQAYCARGLH